ncbi:UNVERIFIED_CONTAM: hypothetical protein GTU68_046162 [Idotea baltica]|nr:hypothetical protein [Idotea baltica]
MQAYTSLQLSIRPIISWLCSKLSTLLLRFWISTSAMSVNWI